MQLALNMIITALAVVLHATFDFTTESLSIDAITIHCVQGILIVITIYAFATYDRHMQETNTEIVQKSAKAMEFVSAMFPEKLRQQLFDHSMTTVSNTNSNNNNSDNPNDDTAPDEENGFPESILHRSNHPESTHATDESLQLGADIHTSVVRSAPIAELYPETTIMIADLVGFTAWSAVREPTQVFILLEAIFLEFDEIAARRNIFKVETVGDCYVAVAGVPEPRSDHAVEMARFARDCMMRFHSIVQNLERTLGSGTSDLGMRIGLNSGPITGGILRGERSRFQLFGDTINTGTLRFELYNFLFLQLRIHECLTYTCILSQFSG
jgi:class 3 adenylate cyclase